MAGKAGRTGKTDSKAESVRFRSAVDAKGFTILPNCVLYDSRLSDGAKVTYLALLEHARQDDSCFPGQERLGAMRGCSDRTIRNHLAELSAIGLVTSEQRSRDSNTYWIETTESVYGAPLLKKVGKAGKAETKNNHDDNGFERETTPTRKNSSGWKITSRWKNSSDKQERPEVIYNNVDSETLNVTLALDTKPGQGAKPGELTFNVSDGDAYRQLVLEPLQAVETLTRDRHSRARLVQLREICLSHNKPDAWDAAVRSTTRRMGRKDLAALERPGAWFDSAVVRELDKRGIAVPTKAEKAEAPDIRGLIGASLGLSDSLAENAGSENAGMRGRP